MMYNAKTFVKGKVLSCFYFVLLLFCLLSFFVLISYPLASHQVSELQYVFIYILIYALGNVIYDKTNRKPAAHVDDSRKTC